MTADRYVHVIAGLFVLISLALGFMGKSLLLPVHRLRRREPVPVRPHELVSDDQHSPEAGCEGVNVN